MTNDSASSDVLAAVRQPSPAAPSQELFESRFGPMGLYRNNGDTFRDGYVAALADVKREAADADAQLRASADSSRLRDLVTELAEALAKLLASASPHQREHPAMSLAWQEGRDALRDYAIDAALRQETKS